MSRDLTYDGLRGWLLIIIACNHLFGSFVTQFTRTPLGFVSAAEGFVFLSGFVAYLVYGRLANNRTELRRKVWRRCLVIYGFHLSAILICFSLVLLFPLYVTHWSVFLMQLTGLVIQYTAPYPPCYCSNTRAFTIS